MPELSASQLLRVQNVLVEILSFPFVSLASLVGITEACVEKSLPRFKIDASCFLLHI
jgi:hypothetical protein